MRFLWISAAIFLCQAVSSRQVIRDGVGVRVIEDEDTPKARRMAGNPAVMTDADRQAMLDLHNQYRSTTAAGQTPNQPGAAYMEKLVWDPALERVAQNYANGCVWGHNGNRQSEYAGLSNQQAFLYTDQGVGENLYSSSSTSGTQSLLLAGITLWYDEYAFYTFNTQACKSGEMCGHYTQMVWDDTRYLGCAYQICSMGTYLVCNYAVAGNFPRQPYTTGSACSSCPTDRPTCSSNLCSGCPSLGFYQCNLDKYSNCPPGATNSLSSYCINCGKSNQNDVCDWCPKTCNYCSAVSAADQQSPSCCPDLNPRYGSCSGGGGNTGGGGGNNPLPTPQPTNPTPRPTTRQPTPPPVPSPGAACTGLQGTQELYFKVSSANCDLYSQAMKLFRPCITVVSCNDVEYPGFSSYRLVTLVFNCDEATWYGTSSDAWRLGIEDQLTSRLGVVFSGASSTSHPPPARGSVVSTDGSNSNGGKKEDPTAVIIGVVIGVVLCCLIGAGCVYMMRKRDQTSNEYRMFQEQQTDYHPPTAPIIN